MIYVLSDIHGNLANFKSIMKQIKLKPDDTLYVLGDVIDRYPDGIKIIRKLMKMPNAKMLLGNHEYMMLEAIDDPFDSDNYDEQYEHLCRMRLWYDNQGRVTHNYLKHIRKDVRSEIFRYLRGLPTNLEIEVNGRKYRLVHGAPKELYTDYQRFYDNETECAVWQRWKDDDPDCDDCIGVFGHTPTQEFQKNNPLEIWTSYNKRRIGIDCGSGYPTAEMQHRKHPVIGRLACLRLDDMKVFYSEVKTIEEEKKNE